MDTADRSIITFDLGWPRRYAALMQRGTMRSRLVTTANALKPCLRVIALVYTGLGGMLAMALVVSVALVPIGPALQQVAEPARQAVSNFVQPTTDAVTTFFGGG